MNCFKVKIFNKWPFITIPIEPCLSAGQCIDVMESLGFDHKRIVKCVEHRDVEPVYLKISSTCEAVHWKKNLCESVAMAQRRMSELYMWAHFEDWYTPYRNAFSFLNRLGMRPFKTKMRVSDEN